MKIVHRVGCWRWSLANGQAWCSSRFILTAAVAALACFTEAFPAYQKDADADPAGDGTGRIDCRKIYPVVPPMVEYSLTPAGQLFIKPLQMLKA